MKINLISLFAFSSLQILMLTNCAQQNQTPVRSAEFESSKTSNALSVQDVNANAIAGAQILIGSAVGNPFKNNLFTTDSKGSLAIPTAWTAPASVSISAPGYITASFLHTSPGAHIFKLRKVLKPTTIEYSGQTTGYPPFDDYSVANVSLVFEALKRSDLANFSVSSIVSHETDQFSVLGNSVSVPSNLAIPDQTLSYIIHIDVSKPQFHLPLAVSSNHLMIGLHAQFPVTQLVKSVQNNASIFDMINFFNFTSMNQQNQVVGTMNIDSDMNIGTTPLSLKNHLQTQSYSSGLVLLAISSLQQSDALIPLDVKSVASGASVDLNTLTSAHTSEQTITVLRSSDTSSSSGASQETMSLAIHPASLSVLPVQLPVLAPPTLSGTVLTQTLPATPPSAIKSGGMYYSYSGINTQSTSSVLVETKEGLWDIYNPYWEASTRFPVLPSQMLTVSPVANASHRWSVSLVGQDTTSSSTLGPDRLTSANFLSRSAVDLE